MEKSCENCRFMNDDPPCLKWDCRPWELTKYWEPDYHTLEQENAKLTQALEQAYKWIMHVIKGDCDGCPLKNNCPGSNYGLNCVEELKKHSKEATQ